MLCYMLTTVLARGGVYQPAHTPWPLTSFRADRKHPVRMKILDIPQSGKLGLVVSMPGRYGQCRRALVIPTNPRTAYQEAVRDAFTKSAKEWRDLTEAQRLAWHGAAANVQSASRLGQSGPLTGSQHYLQVNATLRQFGQPAVEDPPASAAFGDLAPTGLVIENNAGVIKVSLTCPDDPGVNTVLRAAKPLSAGRNKTSDYRILGMCPVPAAGKSDITALYTARFGAPEVGKKVFVQLSLHVNGQESLPRTFSAIVPQAA